LSDVELDCRTCGACCVNPPSNRAAEFPWWVEVEPDDRLLSREILAKKLVVRDADGVPHLRLTPDGRCMSLRGALGVAVSCAIYIDRPTACRTVQPGDELCLLYRADHASG
jgi:Fe-S-cluster containining protein